jgi:hypothetical protein
MNGWTRPGQAASRLLEGIEIRLGPAQSHHLPFLHDLAVRHELAFRWLRPAAVVGPAELERALAAQALECHIVSDRSTGRPVAMVACYDADLQHGHAKVALTAANDPGAILLGLHGATLFVEYLFSVWQFRRLYVEVPEDWSHVANAGAFSFARQEARLRDHCFYQGAYHDLLVLAVDRERWQEAAVGLLDEIQDLRA